MVNPFRAVWASLASQGMGRAMRHRDYRVFSITHWISAVGMWIQRVGVGWLTWELTHSGTWLGVIAAVEALPAFVLTPLAGTIADRVDRLRLFRNVLTVNLTMAGTLAVLTLNGAITIYLLVVIIGIGGVANAMVMPVRMTMAPAMVPREDMAAAIGFNSISFQLSAFLGPAAAGLIITGLGVGYAFAINCLSYGIFIAALFTVRLKYDERSGEGRSGLLSATWEGILYLARHASIGPLLLLILAAAVFTRPFMELLPGFADAIFSRGADGLAILIAAAGVGGMIAGLWLAQYGRTERMTVIVLCGVLATCVSLVLFASTGRFWLAVFWVAVAAAAATVTSTGSQMLIQNAVDGSMRGRVMSIYGLTWRGAPALGALGMGALSSLFGLQAPVIGGAVLCLAALAFTLPRRRIIAAGLESAAAHGGAAEPAETRRRPA